MRVFTHGLNTKENVKSNNDTETDMIEDTQQPDLLHHHDYGVLIVNYHKTGHVLTRALTNLAVNIEYVAKGLNKTGVKMMKNNYPSSGYNVKIGKRVAFARLRSISNT